MIRRVLISILASAVLAAGGVAVASAFTAGGAPSAVTVTTITVPEVTTVTVPAPRRATPPPALSPADAKRLEAADADPAAIPSIRDARTRTRLTLELRDLDVLLADRPTLRPYREHIWYVAHHVRPAVYPRRLAALLWCTVWFPRDCG